MATSNLILNATDSFGKSINKTITNLNPAVDSNTAKTFAQMLNGFTTNTYVSTNRVDKANVDTEATGTTPDTRATPTLTLASSPTKEDLESGILINYSGDGDLYAYTTHSNSGAANTFQTGVGNVGSTKKLLAYAENAAGFVGTIHLCATGTANYKPVEVTFTVTA